MSSEKPIEKYFTNWEKFDITFDFTLTSKISETFDVLTFTEKGGSDNVLSLKVKYHDMMQQYTLEIHVKVPGQENPIKDGYTL